MNFTKRIPKNYDGTQPTSKQVSTLLSNLLAQVGKVYNDRPEVVVAAWPAIVGGKIATMTEAIGLENGILTVKVKNSTLYSLLNQYDKPRILSSLRAKFPSVEIRNIYFRMG